MHRPVSGASCMRHIPMPGAGRLGVHIAMAATARQRTDCTQRTLQLAIACEDARPTDCTNPKPYRVAINGACSAISAVPQSMKPCSFVHTGRSDGNTIDNVVRQSQRIHDGQPGSKPGIAVLWASPLLPCTCSASRCKTSCHDTQSLQRTKPTVRCLAASRSCGRCAGS